MRVVWFVRTRAWWASVLLAGWLAPSSHGAENPLSADDVVARAVARSQQASAQPGHIGYTYTKLTETEEFDAAGKVKEHKEKTYKVFFKDGSTYIRLVEVNGRAPADADLKKHAESESNARQIAGDSKNRKGDNRENLLTPEIVAHFDFALLEETTVNGRRAYQVSFQPKSPELPTRHIIDRLLNRLSGKLCIDAEEFEIARAEINLGSEVNLLGGVVGSLKKMAYIMTRTRVADGIWFNSSSNGDFVGRKLLDATRIKTKSEATNFRRLT